MAEFLRTQPEPSDLLTIAYEGIVVARIDREGLFHCYDQVKMCESLRGQADRQQQQMLQLPKKLDWLPVIAEAKSGILNWVRVTLEGSVTQDVREKVLQDLKVLSVDTCPAPDCGSPFVVHVESAKGVRHICAECWTTWEDCHWVPPKEVT